MKIKFHLIKKSLARREFMMLCLFMILQGFCMPTFMDFSYSFALNVQGISKFTIGLAPVFSGFTGAICPFLFNKYLIKKEAAFNIMISQVMVIFASFSCILISTRFNLKLGIPDTFLYLFGSQFAEIMEIIILQIQIKIMIAQIVPPGVEGTVMAFGSTILGFDMFLIRNLIGVFVNSKFFGVTTENIRDNYVFLTLIKTAGSILPCFFIYAMIPSNEQIKAIQYENIEKINKAKQDSDADSMKEFGVN
jgi:hypothetical protein